ncbi:DNA cytosine methyltransferase [Afipia massiliensis]|uniref:Cytosine-specific methyltransferase n=1 Tax=Afipia massiliensis TaxID=211460 RepID=A0A4U6BKX8_9BRAD|nr:DNA cytosine methyltransferase [Afipia massiliensis]TKT70872.1 DNA cytosine methyltransferase [Afipia massiliensis]
MHNFFEFFAGGGMARAGLGLGWNCVFANEFDIKKTAIYKRNWIASDALSVGDVGKLTTKDISGTADLVWASFPCQDLSLAGAGAGLRGDRSGTYWPFWRLMEALINDGRAPKLIVLENVCGTLTSHDGKDFTTICSNYSKAGYRFGALIVDAVHFVPHSRARLFVVGIREDLQIPESLIAEGPGLWHPRNLQDACERLSAKVQEKWIWWNTAPPAKRNATFADLIEDEPENVAWHTPAETAKLLNMMSDINRKKLDAAKLAGRRMVGAVYKRTRRDSVGRKVQRAEIRFDDVAGCLRTPAGGSSRQVIVIVDGKKVRSRLISPRETARLMGLPDSYQLPQNYNEAYHLTGDGVAVPVVRYLAQSIFEPLLNFKGKSRRAA